MKLLKKLSIVILCLGMALGYSAVSANDWNLPSVGITIPGGIPSTERQYVLYLKVVDADTGEEVNTQKYNRPYEWYVPICMAQTPNYETTKVKIFYRLGQWQGGFDGQWINVTDVLEVEMDIVNGWNFTFLEVEGLPGGYTIGVCKEVEEPGKSDNNYLASLEVERGRLEPAFTPENTDYKLQLDEDVDELTIHVKLQDEQAFTSQETIITPLSKGENRIGITVNAEDGSQRYYMIMVRCGNGETSEDEEDNDENQSSGSGSQGRYNTSRDLDNFTKVTHVATKVSTNGVMIANSGLTAEQAVASLSLDQKSQILTKLKQKIPYTSLGYTLTVNELKSATQNLFTDEQINEILNAKDLMMQLGINLDELVTTVVLKNRGGVLYSDVNETDLAKTAIDEAISLGILEDTEDGKFYPNNNIKMNEALAFLDGVLLLNHIETMKLGRSTVELYFKDINIIDYPYIGSVASKLQVKTMKNLVTKQLAEGITRQEMAQIVYEITEGKLETSPEEVYIADIGDNTYEPALTYAVKAGIMEITNDCIIPSQNLTKGETIKILMKLNKAIQNMQMLEVKAKEEVKNNVITDPLSDPIVESSEEKNK